MSGDAIDAVQTLLIFILAVCVYFEARTRAALAKQVRELKDRA